MASVHNDVAGYYKLEAVKADGARRLVADWFPNIITDGGLNRMGAFGDWLTWCQVGSGTSTPSAGNTALANRVAGSSTVQSSATGARSDAPYYVWRRNTYRFTQGTAMGNLSEVGVGWASTGSLYSRALILDSNGQPTTITVLSDETLDVTYETRYYPKVTDSEGSVTLDGNEYAYVMRAATVSETSATSWLISSSGESQGRIVTSQFAARLAYNGAIGTLVQNPSGTSSTVPLSVQPYAANSLERRFVVAAGLNDGNFGATGLGALRMVLGIGAYQVGFTPNIPKTSEHVLNLEFSISWGRRV